MRNVEPVILVKNIFLVLEYKYSLNHNQRSLKLLSKGANDQANIKNKQVKDIINQDTRIKNNKTTFQVESSVHAYVSIERRS